MSASARRKIVDMHGEIEQLRAQLAECQRELEAVKTKALMNYAVAAGDCIIAREHGYKEGFNEGIEAAANECELNADAAWGVGEVRGFENLAEMLRALKREVV